MGKLDWSGRRDSNPGPFDPQSNALPDCATPRSNFHKTIKISKTKGPSRRTSGRAAPDLASGRYAPPTKSIEREYNNIALWGQALEFFT